MVAKHFAVNSSMAQLRANDWAGETSGSAFGTAKASQSEAQNQSNSQIQSRLAACMRSLESTELSRNALQQRRKESGRLVSFSTRDLHALTRERNNYISFDLSSKVGLLNNAKEAQKSSQYITMKQKKLNA